jgi:hypothetical protein
MKVGKTEAGLLVNKLEQCAHEYDFNWRLFARLCITAGMKNKFREVAEKISEQYSFPFADADSPISGLLMSQTY